MTPGQKNTAMNTQTDVSGVNLASAQERIKAFSEERGRNVRDRAVARALMQMGKISAESADQIKAEQTRQGDKSFAATATRLGFVKRSDVRHAMAVSHGLLREGSRPAALPRDLVLLRAPTSKQAETFRAARTELLTCYEASRTRCLSIASIGTTRQADFVSINLAASFALLKRRTLLIDADLRRNRLAQAFRMGEPTGLVDVLCRRATPDDACLETTVENLWLMPVGQPTPEAQELLAQESFDDLLKQMAGRFDNIVVVGAPFGPTADGRYVWKACGGVVAVIRQHRERARNLEGLQQALRSVNAETVGALLVK